MIGENKKFKELVILQISQIKLKKYYLKEKNL